MGSSVCGEMVSCVGDDMGLSVCDGMGPSVGDIMSPSISDGCVHLSVIV